MANRLTKFTTMESTKQIKIEIRNRWTGSVVFEYTKEGNTITETVLDAIRRGADLSDANLCGADLHGSNLRCAKGCYLSCPTEGSFIGWKKASGHIVKLRIPEDARYRGRQNLEIIPYSPRSLRFADRQGVRPWNMGSEPVGGGLRIRIGEIVWSLQHRALSVSRMRKSERS